MKVVMEPRSLTVLCRQKDWREATGHIRSYKDEPPNGYKLIKSHVSRRSKSGQAANLTLEFEHCDSRVDPFTLDEAYDFFRHLEPFKGARD